MPSLPDIGPFRRRLDELDAQMADPSFYSNPRRAAEVRAQIETVSPILAATFEQPTGSLGWVLFVGLFTSDG